MAIQRSARNIPAQVLRSAVAIGAVLLACQAQAAAPRLLPQSQPQAQAPRQLAQAAPQSQFDRDEHGHNGGNDRDRRGSAPRLPPVNMGHDDHGGFHGDKGHGDEGHGHDHGNVEGPRGRPPVVRPPIHRPPHPVIVVPPCKRGGPGITPC